MPRARPGPANRAARTDPRDLPPPPLPTVPYRAGPVPGLAVEPVTAAAGRRLWAAMTAREHPLGPARAAGCRIRYFPVSGTDVPGGFLFAAATRVQDARDRWIGWTPALCAANRHLVVGMARFPIRPGLPRCRRRPRAQDPAPGARPGDGAALVDGLHDVRAVAVMDREGDASGVFDAWRRLGGRIDILVRARHNRSLGKGRHRLSGHIRLQPVGDRMPVTVPRLSPRHATRARSAFPGRAAREAIRELRWAALDLPVPAGLRPKTGPRPIRLNVVHVRETAAPGDGPEAIERRLPTSLPVTDAAGAREVVHRYRLRRRTGDWHRVSGTGCAVETVAHHTRERAGREATLRAVIAWRLPTLALLGRDTPDPGPSVLFSETGRAVIADFARARRLPAPENPVAAIGMPARMGGHLHRRHDAHPGTRIVREGYTCLSHSAATVEPAPGAGSESRVARPGSGGSPRERPVTMETGAWGGPNGPQYSACDDILCD